MTKLNSINQNSIYDKLYSQQTSYSKGQKNTTNNNEENSLAVDNEKELQEEKQNVLSNSEINTLHMFFGSKKPEELQFYGNNKVDKIHKGQFLDLKG